MTLGKLTTLPNQFPSPYKYDNTTYFIELNEIKSYQVPSTENTNRNFIFMAGKRSVKTQALPDLRYVQCQDASRMY